MTKTLLMVNRQKYNLNTNEGFVNFLTSKLITCFICSFTFIMKPQSFAHLLNGSEHIYWILDLGWSALNMGFVGKWLQECKSNEFFQNRAGGQQFSGGSKKLLLIRTGGCPRPILTVRKFRWGVLSVRPILPSPWTTNLPESKAHLMGCHILQYWKYSTHVLT